MGTRSFIEKLFRLVAPPNAMKLNRTTEATLARSLSALPPEERGWITFAEARSLFSTTGAQYAFGETDQGGRRNIELVCGAAPIRHQLHAGRGPGLFRTRSTAMTSRCDRHSRLSVMGLCAAANLAASTGTSVRTHRGFFPAEHRGRGRHRGSGTGGASAGPITPGNLLLRSPTVSPASGAKAAT